MIFPNIKGRETKKLELNSLKEIALDFEKDEPIIKNNEFLIVEGIEALKVWVYKTIKTTRFKYLVYSNAYGTSIKNFIGKVFTEEVKRDFKKEVVEALLINNYIESVSIIEYKLDYNKLFLSLKIETKINKTLNFEVSFNV
ncbi:DUF2634 domain-containing protein [Candidatus Arthromitus sp. SFB-turkey]|uniref:DUF2634 domain-containing protein n=1 Tax=Candidatus Arthromitus sp. SFB-turkey TaxID=1840217 RepID=UPI0007F4CC57|nr:DUF2634 domain-containing protein [Candidatus Arthromitus sp. SFB-turkey]OAT88275.1 hypothetical protein A6P36_04015 [Candidatus Arthromitus sp. SFB-turkey]